MNWKKWLEGLAFAAGSGFVTGGAQFWTAGQFTKTSVVTAAAGAVAGVLAWLRQPGGSTPAA